MPPRIYLSPPHMGGLEQQYVQEAFDSNWVSPAGPHIVAFEEELAAYAGTPHCAALSSGTAAIHLALILLDVGRDDEVICPTFTFSGSCNPVVYQGATPVFVDSDPVTWNLDPDLLSEAIEDRIKKKGKKPKAIIVVHLYGMPARMSAVKEIAQRFEIPIIEDAAEALGSEYDGKKLGTFGDFGIYSFNGNKIITTSGGGALVSENKAWIERARFLATQARDPAPYYQHSVIGYNYRLSNICAGIGRGQLRVLDDRIKKRRANFEFYRDRLASVPGLAFLAEPKGSLSNRWLTTMLVEKNARLTPEKVRQFLEAENIESRPLWKPMHLQPVFRGAPAVINGTSEAFFETGLCLPSGSSLETADLERICDLIRSVVVTASA